MGVGWGEISVWPSDEEARTASLGILRVFPMPAGHTVGPWKVYEHGRYDEVGGKKEYHGLGLSPGTLSHPLPISLDQMTKARIVVMTNGKG